MLTNDDVANKGITINYKDWMLAVSGTVTTEIYRWLQLDAGLYLSDALDGYMTGPVAFYKNQPIEAMSIKIRGEELMDFKLRLKEESSTKYHFLYQPIWVPAYYQFSTMNPLTFEVELKEPITLTEAHWIIRYGECEK